MSAPFTVPGLISDEALLDYLKTNVRSQKDTTPQPPMNSAVEFADRLGREYIDSPLAKANDRLRSTTSQPTMDAVRSAPRSFSEADVNQTEMRGTLDITPFGGFAQGGEVQKLDDQLFTPEMAQQEADAELKDAQARETAIKDKAAMRERLRSMSAEEAAQLGFNPEIPVGGQELAQERLRDQSRVTAAEEATAGAQAKSEDTGKQAQQSATFSAIQNAIRTFSQFVPSAAKTAVIYGWEVPRGQLNTEGENASVPRQRLQASEEALNKLFPGDQARKDDFMQQVGAGAGSMAAFLLGGYLLAGAGIGTGTAMAASGMLASGSEMFEDAERHDGTALQKYISLFVGTGLGATEAIPISRAFMRAEKASGGLVSRMLRETVAQSAEEFLQEFGQAFGTDFLAKMIYDPDRKMDWQQYLENGLVGAILGGAVGGAVGAAGAPKDRTVSDEQRDQAVQAALTGAKRAFDATMVDDVADVALSAVGNETLRKTKPAGTDAEFDLFQGPGGSVPVNERGRLEIRHWSDQQLAEIDPAYRGTGPLYGEERHRLGSRASQDENVVDRAYFGAGNAPTEADMAKLQADLKAAQKKKQRVENPDGTFSYPRDEAERAAYARLETLGYRKEGGLGTFLHVAEVDPSVVYNAVEDVRKLKDRVDKALTKSEQLTQFERLVRDEGFEGLYYPQSGLGQTVLMFNKVAPSRTVDERYGLPTTEIATPADFNRPTAETFVKKGGWAVVTATQEALGHHSVQANVEQNEKLEKYLIKNKIPYQRVAGSYQGVDQGPNFMVFMPEDEALKLGKRFKQESILTREGLEYTDGSGRLVPAVPEHTIVGPEAREQDFFSTLPDGTSFTIGLDFGEDTAVDDDAGDILNKLTTPEKIAQLAETIPGFKGAVKYLTPEEAERVAGRTAQKFVDIFESLPSAHEMAHVAVSGRAKRGWYASSARAIVEIFGANDAPRFAALLAALSPQTSVEMNTINALRVWTAWVRAGRPKTRKAVRVILGTNVQGDKGENSVLDAWVNNSVEALLTEDPMEIKLSGPKVTAFMNNLRGNVNAVTNDAWMANYALVDQNLFKATSAKDVAVDGQPRTMGRAGPGYLAMSAVVRKAAEIASDITGDIWSPAEVQETVWSWSKTLYEKAEATGVSAEELIDAGQLSADEIANTPDFASLFAGGVYGEILKEGGYDVGTVGSSTGADRGDAGRSSPVSSEGTAADQRAFEIYLRDAARRLDALRERRAGEKGGAENSAAEDLEIDAEGTTLGLPDEDYDAILSMPGGTSNRRARFRGERGRPDQGVPVDPAQSEAVDPATASLRQITDHFVKALELTVRQGRLTKTGKGDAAGQYNIRTGVIRVENTSDLSTVVHEGAHAIERQAGPALRKFVDDRLEEFKNAADKLYGSGVTTTAMLNNEVHKAEGFAEFFRVYVLNPRYTEKHFTKLYDDFNQFLESNDPRLMQQLRIVSAEFEAYTKLSSVDVMRGMVVTARKDSGFVAAIRELQQTGFSTWMQEVTRASIRDMANKYAPLNQIVAQALNLGEVNQGKAIDLKMAEDPRVLIRLAANSGSRAMTQITDGVLGYQSVNPISRGLREALLRYHGLGASDNLPMVDPVREADFSTYITALRAKDEYRRYSEGKIPNPPIGLLEGDVDQAITDLDGKYGEDFSEAAAIVHEYAMALWERMHDAGLLTDESYTEGLDRQFYVPLIRDMTDVKGERGRDGGKATGGDPAKLVKRFKGSDRPVIDPFATLMQKTFALEKVIAENDVKRAMARLSDRVGTAGALIERIPAHRIIGRNLDLKELARDIVKASDLSADEATELMTLLEAPMDNGVSISIFERLQALAGNDNVVFFWEKGRVAAIQLQDGDVGLDIMNVLNGVGREAAPWYVDLVAWTSSTFRSSITLWPDFLIVNFIRDQFSTFILNENYVPFVTGLRGVGEELRQSQWAKQYNASMAVMGGMNVATLHQARVQNDIRVLRSKGYLAKIFSQEEGLKRFMKGFASFTELTETGTRMGLYRATFERAKADGLTDYEASVEAAYRATDTMDFGLHGSRLTTARRLIPFLNAQIQGLYKMMRTLGADEVRQRKGLTFALSAYFKDVNRLELSRTERAAIRTGRKAWIKMASLAVVSAALALLYEDDPDYQETSEYMRQTGWVIPYGDGRIAYIPKPFELALLANFTERAIEYGSGDPTSKDRFLRGLAMTLTPPTAPPVAQTLVEQLANYDFFSGREIVPDYMQALAGDQQYSNYTSEMAKQIAKITGWSAMRIDHVLSGLGASAYRDVSTMTNQLNPNRPDLGWTDTPIVRRFIRDARRGSTSGQDFWKYASTTTGLLTRASRTYRNYIDQGNDRAANEFLESLPEDEQAFALLDTHFKADAKRINPFYRNRQIATIVSAMRREISSDLGLEDTDKLADSPTIRMTGREKRDASEALMELARRETRNTLVYSQTPGWDNKKPLDVETTMDVLEQIDPRVRAELDRRLKKANVYSADFVREYWPEVKNRLLADRENSFLKDIVKAAQ